MKKILIYGAAVAAIAGCSAKKTDDVLEIEKKLMKAFPKESWAKIHLQLVLFGRYYCQAIHPRCLDCRLAKICNKKNIL